MFKIENRLFTEWRLRAYGLGVIFLLALTIGIICINHLWPFLSNGNPTCIDFGIFWVAGKLAASGDVARIFDHSAFSDAQSEFFRSCPTYNGINPNRFWYPPTYLFLIYPFALLPYPIALIAWISISFALYLAAVYAIILRRVALVVAATPIVVLLNLYLGQNGFFTAALVGLSLVFMERRPWLAGMLLGLLTYKPHFGVLFPIALLASRNWRALSSAAVTTLFLGVLIVIAFGHEGWSSFIHAFTERTPGLGGAPGVEPRLHSVFGMLYLTGAGASPSIAWCVQLVVSAIVAFSIWKLWATPISYNLKATALCAALFLVSPYVLGYDLCILAIAVAFLIKEGLLQGFLPGERIALFVCWISLWFFMLPIGPVVSGIILLIVARRIVIYRGINYKESRNEFAVIVYS